MTLLSPWIFAAALAAMAVPILVLHMLRLRRQPRSVSSTLLWRRTVEDLVANAPFQRLRWSLLLLLQMAVAAAIAAALGRPTSAGAAELGRQVVVLLDRSASMGAVVEAVPASGAPRTRLDLARAEARRVIDAADDGVEVMLVAFAERPVAIGGFERSRTALEAALAGIQQTDEEADLDAALAWASAIARGTPEESEGRSMPTVVVITDGNVRPPAEGVFEVAAGAVDVRVVPALADGARTGGGREGGSGGLGGETLAGPPDGAAGGDADGSSGGFSGGSSGERRDGLFAGGGTDNVGITALAAERRYDDPAVVNVFVRLANSGPVEVQTVVSVEAGDRVLVRRSARVPGARGADPGEATLLERVELREGGILVVRQGRPDLLASDDVAAARLPAPRRPKVTVVAPGGPGARASAEAPEGASASAEQAAAPEAGEGAAPGPDPFLLAVLEAAVADPGAEDRDGGVRVVSEAGWRSLIASGFGDAGVSDVVVPDLVVFDRVVPSELPPVPSLTIGVVPPWLAAAGEGDASDGVGTGRGEADVRPRSSGSPRPGESDRARRVLSWQRGHPLLRHVDLDELAYRGAAFDTEAAEQSLGAEPLALGADGVVLATVMDRGVRHASLAFALRRSNLPALPAFPVLIQNAIDWLGAAGAGQAARTWRPGEPVSVRARPDAARLELRGPGGEVREVQAEGPLRTVVLPPLERSGVWTVGGAVAEDEIVPVSQLSELESNLAAGAVGVGGEGAGSAGLGDRAPPLRPGPGAAGSTLPKAGAPPISVIAPRDLRRPDSRYADLWPLAVGAALVLLMLEGLVWAVRAGRA